MNCRFKGNEAAIYGGAVVTRGAKLVIRSSLFQYNAAGNKYTSTTAGGAVFAVDNSIVEIRNSFFRGNKATYAGGAVCAIRSQLIVESSSFEKSKALCKHTRRAIGGALFAWLNSVVKILRSSVMRNEATYNGGAISFATEKIVITSSLFEHNTAVSRDNNDTYGRAIHVDLNTSVMILDCSLKANLATFAGGAIHTQGHKLSIRSTLFERNTALCKTNTKRCGYGGAVNLDAVVSISNIQNSSFIQNNASSQGCAISTAAKNLVITSSVFEYNTAGSSYYNITYGGAIYAYFKTSVKILNCSLKANLAAYGGAIFSLGNKLIVRSTLFEHNTALSIINNIAYGGAIYAYFKTSVKILNCSLKANLAALGGAIFSLGNKLIVRSTLFERNTVLNKINGEGGGGAIAALCNIRVKIFNCSLKANSAAYNGDAIHREWNKLIIRSTSFECNTANKGGAITVLPWSVRSKAYVKASQFKNNSAAVAVVLLHMEEVIYLWKL